MRTALRKLEQAPSAFILLLGYALLFLVWWADYKLGYQLSVSLFYLLPIVLVTWGVGKKNGLLIVFISTLAWLYADLLAGHTYTYAAIPYWNAVMRAGFFLSVSLLIAQLQVALRRERLLSRMDVLTGLSNSRAFYELVEQEQQRAKRYQRVFSLAYIDLDDFKDVNDEKGHHEGDRVLMTVAKLLTQNLRSVDKAARLGGDEFAILFPETTREGTLRILGKIRDILNSKMDEMDWPITLSVGAVVFHQVPDTVAEIVKQADTLMYKAKKHGKDQIMCEEYL